MKEIKFKFGNKTTKEMSKAMFLNEVVENWEKMELGKQEILQFTETEDKKGKEIGEGDIVVCPIPTFAEYDNGASDAFNYKTGLGEYLGYNEIIYIVKKKRGMLYFSNKKTEQEEDFLITPTGREEKYGVSEEETCSLKEHFFFRVQDRLDEGESGDDDFEKRLDIASFEKGQDEQFGFEIIGNIFENPELIKNKE